MLTTNALKAIQITLHMEKKGLVSLSHQNSVQSVHIHAEFL